MASERRRATTRWATIGWRGLTALALTLGLLGGGLPLATPAAAASTIVVNSTLDIAGIPQICTLRDALLLANDPMLTNGCTPQGGVTSPPTIYFSSNLGPTATIELGSTLPTIAAGVTISGPSRDELTIQRAPTNLNKFRLLEIQTADPVTVAGVTLSGGDAGNGDGGAILASGGGTLTIQNAAISNNTARKGGGIDISGGTLAVLESTFSNNTATGTDGLVGGGGIAIANSSGTVVDSTFSANSGIYYGGGFFSSSSTLALTNTTVSGNTAMLGGGIYAINPGGVLSTLAVTGSTFSANNASSGGAFFTNSTVLTITDSTVSTNTGTSDGGGLSSGGPATITNSRFTGNTTSGSGGGIYAQGFPLTLIGSTVAGNTASEGGGLTVVFNTFLITGSTISGNTAQSRGGGIATRGNGTTLVVTNSTIANNTAGNPNNLNSGSGGGIYANSGSLNSASLTNVTIGGNSAAQGGGLNLGSAATLTNMIIAAPRGGACLLLPNSSLTDGGGNLDSDGTCVFTAPSSQSNADPLLGPLQDNGGPTLTFLPAPGSPARDAGVASVCAATGPDQPGGVDQRGAARAAGSCDSGAVEVFAIAPTPLPGATFGAAYSQQLSASGGGTAPYTFAVTGGALPAGLTLSPAGALTGTPTAAGNAAFTITATDNAGFTDTQPYTLAVAKATATLTLGGTGTFTADGQPHAATATTSPAGLATVTITYTDSATGSSSTTPPTAVGSYAVTATLDNPTYAATPATGTITIVAAPSPSPTPSPTPAPVTFADVPADYWAAPQIAQVAQRSITTGCDTDAQGNRYYCPARGVTRAEMAVFLTRTLGTPLGAPTGQTFADVPADHWAAAQIEAFAQLGITTGCGDDAQGRRLYCPDRGVTRAEMAVFLVRAKGQTTLDSPAPTFADVPPTYWAYGWIERVLALDVTTGCGEDENGNRVYCPDRGVTRAEMAVFIIRAYP